MFFVCFPLFGVIINVFFYLFLFYFFYYLVYLCVDFFFFFFVYWFMFFLDIISKTFVIYLFTSFKINPILDMAVNLASLSRLLIHNCLLKTQFSSLIACFLFRFLYVKSLRYLDCVFYLYILFFMFISYLCMFFFICFIFILIADFKNINSYNISIFAFCASW